MLGMRGVALEELCRKCGAGGPEQAASSAIVRREASWDTWSMQPPGTAVHLVALFRDPGIAARRPVSIVLDIRARPDGELAAGERCWVKGFLRALSGLPQGLTVALDNGVRCPTRKQRDRQVYWRRAEYCHQRTLSWLLSLQHPDGGKPAVILCDNDLVRALAKLGHLTRLDGTAWRPPKRFVDAVGENLRYSDFDALVVAHPIVLQRRWKRTYEAAFEVRQIVQRLVELARL